MGMSCVAVIVRVLSNKKSQKLQSKRWSSRKKIMCFFFFFYLVSAAAADDRRWESRRHAAHGVPHLHA